MVHLLVQGLVDDRAVLEGDGGILNVRLVQVRQGVLHPSGVVTVREVLVRVRSTGLLPGLRSIHLLRGLIDQVLELQRLDQICVPHHAAIRDADILVLLHDLHDDVLALRQVVRVAVHRRVLLHRHLQLPAEVGRGDGALAVADLVHARDRGLARVGRQRHRRAVRLHELRGGVSRLAAEDHEVEERVGAQAVGAVHGGAARLAGGEEAGYDGVALALQHLGLPVRGDAAHVVVHGGEHRGGLLRHVHAREDLRGLGDARETLREGLRRQVVEVEVDVVLVGAHAAALADLQGHRAAHDVARG
mmetsp:Transcript_86006/g.240669  ORF Transcript_86006/g.240669 Transcript_86006/m.240669 type:complete len:303 (-) Transcript_86006:986-1894(-)